MRKNTILFFAFLLSAFSIAAGADDNNSQQAKLLEQSLQSLEIKDADYTVEYSVHGCVISATNYATRQCKTGEHELYDSSTRIIDLTEMTSRVEILPALAIESKAELLFYLRDEFIEMSLKAGDISLKTNSGSAVQEYLDKQGIVTRRVFSGCGRTGVNGPGILNGIYVRPGKHLGLLKQIQTYMNRYCNPR